MSLSRADRWILGGVLGASVAAILLAGVASAPSRDAAPERAGSTHLAGGDGTRALFEYLDRAGFVPATVETGDLPVPDGGVLVLIDASIAEGEAETLAERVRGGLHLFVATRDGDDPIFKAFALPVDRSGTAGRLRTAWPSPAVRNVERVEVDSPLRAQPAAGFVELLADDAGAGAVDKHLGAGEIVLVLDASVVNNAGLARAHNLRFADSALRHLSGSTGAVVFDEYHHGYGVERTVAGWFSRAGLLPALWLFAFAFVADAFRRHTRRVGPARPPPQPERRAAREFIAGYAGLLRAAGHRGWAVRSLERTLRRRLHDDLGVPLAMPPVDVFRRLTTRAPQAAARAYRALERAGELSTGARVGDRDLLDLARDVRAAERALGGVRTRRR